jgi:hypothetical protein
MRPRINPSYAVGYDTLVDMAAKHKVITSTLPVTGRLTSAERRAAHIASISNKQAELKQEAAERRAKRADQT